MLGGVEVSGMAADGAGRAGGHLRSPRRRERALRGPLPGPDSGLDSGSDPGFDPGNDSGFDPGFDCGFDWGAAGALGADGLADLVEPTVAELWGLAPDPDSDPVEGPEAGVPGEVLVAGLAAEAARLRWVPPGLALEFPAGLVSRDGGGREWAGAGFAGGGVLDELEPGAVLAGFAQDARAGLGVLSGDEVTGWCGRSGGWSPGRPRVSWPRSASWPGGAPRRRSSWARIWAGR